MPEKSAQTPRNVPSTIAALFAILAATAILSEGFVSVKATEAIGRPSSTDAIAYIFIPIYGVVYGIVGWIAGFAVGHIITWVVGPINLAKSTWTALFFVFTFIIASIYSTKAVYNVKKIEEINRPRVIIYNERVKSTTFKQPNETMNELRLGAPTFLWNGEQYKTNYNNNILSIINSKGDAITKMDLTDYDYIREVLCAEVSFFPGNENKYLAVLADLRATGRRSIFAVLSPDGSPVYMELLERVYCDPAISAVESANGEGILVKINNNILYQAKN